MVWWVREVNNWEIKTGLSMQVKQAAHFTLYGVFALTDLGVQNWLWIRFLSSDKCTEYFTHVCSHTGLYLHFLKSIMTLI